MNTRIEYQIGSRIGDTNLILRGSTEAACEALTELEKSEHHFKSVIIRGAGDGLTEIVVEGSDKNSEEALRVLYEADLVDCGHEFQEFVPVDDTRWLDQHGLQERSNPDERRCRICGAFYNEGEEEWQYD